MRSAATLPAAVAARTTPAAEAPGAAARFARALERAAASGGVGGDAAARSSAPLGAAEALALQADLYARAERLELTSKLLDHGVGAVKTLLQTRL